MDSAQAIYDPQPWVFAVIASRMHTAWVRVVAGRLKTDLRYSSALCYNTFPFPRLSDKQRDQLEECVFKVIDEREKQSEKTLAKLYNPEKMPKGLWEAHAELDEVVEQAYRKLPFRSDEERVEYLFSRYEKLISLEARNTHA